MTLQALAPMQILTVPGSVSGSATISATGTLTGTGSRYCAMLCVPETGTVTDIGFAVNGVTTGGNVDVRLETIDLATGFPSGTLYGTNTNLSVDISAGAAWYKATLTGAASVTRGDFVAIVIAGLTSGIAPVFTLSNFADGNTRGTPDIPAFATFAAAAWTLTTAGISVSLEYNGVCYQIPHIWPLLTVTNTAFNNTSTPDVYATKFSIPVRARFCGAWVWVDGDGDYAIKLYDSDGVTVLSSLAVDKDLFGATTGQGSQFFVMPTAILKKNTNYWLGIEPSTATSPTVSYGDVQTAYIMGQMNGGITMVRSTAKDPSGTGSWTDAATSRLFVEPRFDQFDDSAALLVNGGLVY